MAASRKQFVPAWPPVACNMNKTDGNLPATGGHAGTICMRLAATRVQYECDWPPVACYFFMRLAATLVQFVCDWPLDAHYFSTVLWPVAYLHTKSIQSARVSGQSSELAPLATECVPPRIQVGGDTLACGEEVGGSQFRRRDRHYGTLYTIPFSLPSHIHKI